MSESYKHRFAKDTMLAWLRANRNLHWCGPNRDTWPFGVYAEYPVCLDNKNNIVGVGGSIWDEPHTIDVQTSNPPIPTYQECIDAGIVPIAIFDIAIMHKGCFGAAIEIVHKNGVSAEKSQYLRRISARDPFSLFVVPADWILSRCKAPSSIFQWRVVGPHQWDRFVPGQPPILPRGVMAP